MSATVRVENVSKDFGGLRALDKVNLSVEKGSITALIGPNGSGKTTLFNVMTGFLRATEGKVFFDDRDITAMPTAKIPGLGLVRTFQLSVGFPMLTVWENLMVASMGQDGESLHRMVTGRGRIREQEGQGIARAKEVADRIGLGQKMTEVVASLSAPEAKMLEIGRQLMMSPRMMLLDEPSSGVNPGAMGQLEDLILELNAEGMTFFIIGHNLSFIMKLSQYIHVLQYGKLIASGSKEEVSRDERVIEAYLGVHK